MSNNSYSAADITIIGAGPVGLFTVFQAGMLQMSCQVIDALDHVGGQCAALYKDKPIYDIPAYPEILAGDLVQQLKRQADPFHPQYFLSEEAVQLTQEDVIVVKTRSGKAFASKVVIIAAGAGAFGPNKLPIAGAEQFEGKSLLYSVPDIKALHGKRVLIAGGGDSAVDWAIALSDVAKCVTLVHRRDKFRCAPFSLSELRRLSGQQRIDIVTPFSIHNITGSAGRIERALLRSIDEQQERELEVDVVLAFYGLAMDLGSIFHWNLDIKKHQILVDPATMSTNLPNIFAVGDIVTYPGKLKLILTGFAESAVACRAAYKAVHPDVPLHFEHSTSRGRLLG